MTNPIRNSTVTRKLKTCKAVVKRAMRNVAGEEVKPGDIVWVTQHKVRAGTVTISRPKVGISGVSLSDLELLP